MADCKKEINRKEGHQIGITRSNTYHSVVGVHCEEYNSQGVAKHSNDEGIFKVVQLRDSRKELWD